MQLRKKLLNHGGIETQSFLLIFLHVFVSPWSVFFNFRKKSIQKINDSTITHLIIPVNEKDASHGVRRTFQ